jgi:hypothetical protein
MASATNEEPERAERTGGEDRGSLGRRYDSFMLRLWHGSLGHRFYRMELHHLQTGLVETGLDREPDWIVATILDCLGEDWDERDEEPATADPVAELS